MFFLEIHPQEISAIKLFSVFISFLLKYLFEQKFSHNRFLGILVAHILVMVSLSYVLRTRVTDTRAERVK